MRSNLSLVFVTFFVGVGVGVKAVNAQNADTEATLWQMEHDYVAAAVSPKEGDHTTYWHEQFLGWPREFDTPIDKATGVADRQEALESQDSQPRDFAIERLGFRLYDDVAINYYRLSLREPEPLRLRMIHVWIPTDNGWRILGGASSLDPGHPVN